MKPDAKIDGVHIQRQIPEGQEVIIGVVRDPLFGPLMMFGSGGVEVEGLKDVAFALAPLNQAEAQEMIRKTWAGKKLNGFRNIPAVDEESVIDVLIKLSQLADEHRRYRRDRDQSVAGIEQRRGGGGCSSKIARMTQLESFISQIKDKSIGVAVYDLQTQKEILINADEMMHPASTMKVPVMMEVFRQAQAGLLSLDEQLKIFNSFKSIVDGSEFSLDIADDSEVTLYKHIGETESIRELTRLMIVRSSNLASNILMEKVGTSRVDPSSKNLALQT